MCGEARRERKNMAQEERVVLREIPAGGIRQTDFVVEYMDSQGEWVPAAGGWNWGAACRSTYPNEQAAGVMADEIARVGGHRTRIVRVVTRGD